MPGQRLITAISVCLFSFPPILGCAHQPRAQAKEIATSQQFLTPQVKRNGAQATIDWSGIHERIQNKARGLGESDHDLNQLTVSLYINGEETVKNLPWSQTTITVDEEPHRQIDYYIVHKKSKSHSICFPIDPRNQSFGAVAPRTI